MPGAALPDAPQVDPELVNRVRELVAAAVDRACQSTGAELTVRDGKMVFELRPRVEWHKGEAVAWLLRALGLEDGKNVVPVYLGDDVTDEDAFRKLRELCPSAVTVLVAEDPSARETSAAFWLRGPPEVKEFLAKLVDVDALPAVPRAPEATAEDRAAPPSSSM